MSTGEPRDPRHQRQDNPWLIAIAVMFGTFMVVLDTTVVNVSLPHIAGTLSATVNEATWALTSYLAANAIVLPMTGWLASLVGRKRLLMSAVVGFTGASFLCGLSVSLPMLVFFRIVQGLTGGVMQPMSQAVMLEAFAPQDRGKAMGFWGLGIVVAPILGPVLGGYLTENYSWRWVFFINIPVGVVALLAQQTFIFDPPYLRRRVLRIDWWGIGLLAVGVGAVQLALDKGEQSDWFASPWITASLVIGGLSLMAMIVRELVVREPIVDLTVFRNSTYAVSVVLVTLLGFLLFGSMVLLPIMLQTLMGYSALDAGIALAPRGMGSLVAMPIVGLFTSRVDPRKLLASGFVLTGITMFWLSTLSLDVGYWDLFWPQFCQGISLGLLFVPLTTIAMDHIPPAKMGNATSLFNLMRNVGGSVGIAVVSTLLSRYHQAHVTTLAQHVSVWNRPSSQFLETLSGGFAARGADVAAAHAKATAVLHGMVERQAAILSFLDLFRLMAFLAVGMLPLVLLMRRPKNASRPTAAAAAAE